MLLPLAGADAINLQPCLHPGMVNSPSSPAQQSTLEAIVSVVTCVNLQDGLHYGRCCAACLLLCRYADRLPQMPIILLTNDAGNRAAAAAMGLTAMSLGQYVRNRVDAPELQDLVARQVNERACRSGVGGHNRHNVYIVVGGCCL